MKITPEEVASRGIVWDSASIRVGSLVEQHGLEEFRTGAPFQHQTTITKIDQHIDQIIRVADWLLDDHKD